MGGKLTLECDKPMLIGQLGDEGQGMQKQVMHGEWDFQNSGGCHNFGMFDKNPAYVINIKQDSVMVFFRLMVTAELSPDGSQLVTDPDRFKYSVNA